MNLESSTTQKINKQYLKSKYNNQKTLTNNNCIATPLHTGNVCLCMYACMH